MDEEKTAVPILQGTEAVRKKTTELYLLGLSVATLFHFKPSLSLKKIEVSAYKHMRIR